MLNGAIAGVTVAVKATFWLTEEVEGAATSVVVVPVGLTIWLRTLEAPDLKFESDEVKVAVMVCVPATKSGVAQGGTLPAAVKVTVQSVVPVRPSL